MSESAEIIARLVESGASLRSIGDAIGRDSSLLSQVARGRKPGNNLRESLARLEAQVATLTKGGAKPSTAARSVTVAEPTRRPAKAGGLAKVRRATTKAGGWGQSTTMKRQAARNGARGMGHALNLAAGEGREVAVTVSFNRSVTVNNTSGGRRGRTGRGGVVEMRLGDADEVFDAVMIQHGGNFSEYVAAQAIDRGYLSGVADERDAVAHMTGVELRGW